MHDEFTILMSAVLDGEASVAEVERLEEHLRCCSACQATWTGWQALHRRLVQAPMAPAPERFVEHVAERLAAREARRRRRAWLGGGMLAVWLGALAGLLLVCAALILWASANPRVVAVVVSAMTQYASGLVWWLRGLRGVAGGVGSTGLLAGTAGAMLLTATLAGAWVWVVFNGRRWIALRAISGGQG